MWNAKASYTGWLKSQSPVSIQSYTSPQVNGNWLKMAPLVSSPKNNLGTLSTFQNKLERAISLSVQPSAGKVGKVWRGEGRRWYWSPLEFGQMSLSQFVWTEINLGARGYSQANYHSMNLFATLNQVSPSTPHGHLLYAFFFKTFPIIDDIGIWNLWKIRTFKIWTWQSKLTNLAYSVLIFQID